MLPVYIDYVTSEYSGARLSSPIPVYVYTYDVAEVYGINGLDGGNRSRRLLDGHWYGFTKAAENTDLFMPLDEYLHGFEPFSDGSMAGYLRWLLFGVGGCYTYVGVERFLEVMRDRHRMARGEQFNSLPSSMPMSVVSILRVLSTRESTVTVTMDSVGDY